MFGALPSRIARRSTGRASPSISRKMIPGASVSTRSPERRAMRCVDAEAVEVVVVRRRARRRARSTTAEATSAASSAQPSESTSTSSASIAGARRAARRRRASTSRKSEQERERQPQRRDQRRQHGVEDGDDRGDADAPPRSRGSRPPGRSRRRRAGSARRSARRRAPAAAGAAGAPRPSRTRARRPAWASASVVIWPQAPSARVLGHRPVRVTRADLRSPRLVRWQMSIEPYRLARPCDDADRGRRCRAADRPAAASAHGASPSSRGAAAGRAADPSPRCCSRTCTGITSTCARCGASERACA